ncbi:hypothetical protein HMPREF9374_1744 [Desmospora sp. 8437]|nr:hypothetical protein HMPREF9374_1744 [Desmospora sp. 8437]
MFRRSAEAKPSRSDTRETDAPRKLPPEGMNLDPGASPYSAPGVQRLLRTRPAALYKTPFGLSTADQPL